MIDLTAGTVSECREETKEEADVAVLHATIESAYMLGCTPQEAARIIGNDSELSEIQKKVCTYQAGDDIEDLSYSLF